MDDSEIVSAFQAGDEGVFAVLVTRHRRAVYRVARGILGSHEKADEAAQDAFLKVYQGLPRFKGESSFKTWMYRIAMNAALDLKARETTQARAREQARREALAERPVSAAQHALESLALERRRGAVRAAVDLLPERQRTTLLLRIQDELSYEEIAQVLGSPVGTVKANVHHAVQNLRKALGVAGPQVRPGAARADRLAKEQAP